MCIVSLRYQIAFTRQLCTKCTKKHANSGIFSSVLFHPGSSILAT
jgi:hypothetical protein